jgi:son of sevenless-like protein
LKNFNGVMEILSGLETASVQRLKQTWHNLPRKSWDMFEELTDLMSLPQNFKKFRQQINALSPPCVPYIGIFLKDIIFIEQGAQEPDGRMINFEKRTMVAKIVRQMVSFQPYVYNLIPVEFIQEFLFSMKPLNEDDLYHKSLQLEGIGASLPANKKRHKSMFYFPLGANSPRRLSVKEYSSPDDSSS